MPTNDPKKNARYVREFKEGRRAMVAAIKIEQGCADCGYRKCSEALDFDHRPGEEKLFPVSKGLMRKLDVLLVEIAKCDAVCANCHRERTAARRLKVVA